MDEEMATLHGKELGGSQHAAEGRSKDTQAPGSRVVDTSRQHAAASSSGGIRPAHEPQTGVSEEEDESYQYACLVEDEPAADDLK